MSVTTEIDAGIAWVTINRPRQRNAIDIATHEALRALWSRLDVDEAVRVIVLTGAGTRAFCAGADIRDFLPYLRARIAEGADPGDFCGLTHFPSAKPVIAAINGAALGGGLELALAADLRIAVEGAVFGLPEVKLGAIAGAGGIVRLMRALPAALARDMLLTGRSIRAARALEAGLVSEVVSPGMLHAAARALARQIADNSPTALRLTREVMATTEGLPLDAALAAERKAFHVATASEDFALGVQAFAEGGVPSFTGR